MHCTLCGSLTTVFIEFKKRTFHKCSNCDGILLDAVHYLPSDKEKQRYDKHSDNVEDEGYQNFVSPIVNAVLGNYQTKDLGLDYGCGKTAIIQELLQRKQYNIAGYDPIYFPNEPLLTTEQYHYITCCEVVEHFYNPKQEFEKITQFLRPFGKLFLKTNLYSEDIIFEKWWYKNDPTHVFFYSKKTLEYIQKEYNYSELKICKDYIVFTK